ncbi:Sodium:solute symporter family-domain-containing protein [Fomitopsis serialis]|uniref:Sodium:solute symporter family-domain-containing protein n=1 Tax=Fomitopsis serialis TaxID=139415 RepID=UPI0020081831|nr:Sodium:solute symporter family-domain-containing protein [Neoantrodia serialis]KAH9925239.1 Sodium:solute symporter family-domain-containing protein [Neoantrodia serialis]
MSSTEGAQVLSQGVGYGVVLGIGFVFAVLMMGLSTLQNRYTTFKIGTSEEFNTASRSIKPGLIASGIVSAWTWAATLLQSSTVTYEYGLCGGYYYAAGATLQIFLMAILAVRVKMIAPYCHTYLEIVQARYGNTPHLIFVTYGLVTNLIVSSMLLLGGSAVVNAFTGMNIYAANFLIPIGVMVYVILGGLRATFLCDYTHTLILMIIILYFYFYTYTEAELIGGFEGMYQKLQQAAIERPVAGNAEGSYMTLKSNYGLVFMIIQIFGGLGTVMLDQGYWQRAIASKAKTAVRAYLLGGVAWFAVPLTFSSIMGLAAVALANNPAFPYTGGLSSGEIDAGLAAPAGVVALLGKGGAVAMLILLFMAVTSAASSEMIATSSILTFDLYQIHFKPDASPEVLIRVSHIMVAVWAIVMSCVACLWNGIGISLNWLFLFSGTLYTSAVGPIVMSVLWRKQTRLAVICGALGGLCVGVTCWLVVAKTYYGALTVETTGNMYPNLAGNMGSCCSGALISIIVTLIKPDNEFDWSATKNINPRGRAIDEQLKRGLNPTKDSMSKENTNSETATTAGSEKGEKTDAMVVTNSVDDEDEDTSLAVPEERRPEDYETLKKSLRAATWASVIMSFIIVFLIPIPMFLSHYVFSLAFFKAWVIICVIWVFVAAFITSVLPLYESRQAMVEISRGVVRDVFGGGLAKKEVVTDSSA